MGEIVSPKYTLATIMPINIRTIVLLVASFHPAVCSMENVAQSLNPHADDNRPTREWAGLAILQKLVHIRLAVKPGTLVPSRTSK